MHPDRLTINLEAARRRGIEERIKLLEQELNEPAPRVQVIPDLHGNNAALQNLLEAENADHIIFMGDLIDRGRQSKQVLECVKQLVESRKAQFLFGNHEMLMIGSILQENGTLFDAWIRNLGQETIKSLTGSRIYHLEDAVLNDSLNIWSHWLLQNGQFSIQRDSHLFVHAGISSADNLPHLLSDLEEERKEDNLDYQWLASDYDSPLSARRSNGTNRRRADWFEGFYPHGLESPESLHAVNSFFQSLNNGRQNSDVIKRLVFAHSPNNGRIRQIGNNRILGIDVSLYRNEKSGSLILDKDGIRFHTIADNDPDLNPIIEDQPRTIADTDRGREIRAEIERLRQELEI